MSEFVRSVIAQLNGYVAKSNSSCRRMVRLPLRISLATEKSSMKGQQSSSTGFTCDLSKNGLSFIVSSIHLDAKHLFWDKSALRIRIELPDSSVDVNAVAVRYDRFDSSKESGYLVGARIVSISERDCARYYEFLRNPSHKLLRDEGENVSNPAGAVYS